VVDFDADGRGVDGAGFAGVLTFDLQLGSDARAEKAERVEVAFEVSPLTEGVEDAFAVGVGPLLFSMTAVLVEVFDFEVAILVRYLG